MPEDKCTETRRFENLESDLKEIKEMVKEHSTDISALKESNAETRVYVKQIFERIDDLKIMLKEGTKDTTSKWFKIVIELIKSIGIIAGIIAGIKLIGGKNTMKIYISPSNQF